MDNNELMHHGILGMKWGVRRYQNRDGTLTAAGKKRYDKEMAKLKEEERILKNKQRTKNKLDKLEAKRAELDEKKRELEGKKPDNKSSASNTSTTRPKTLAEMTDQELQAVVTRMNLEKRYKELNPPEVSKGQKFLKSFRDDVFIPALKSKGKEAMEGVLKAVLGKATGPIIDKIKGATKKTDETISKTVEKTEEERSDNILIKLPKDKSPNRDTTTKDDAMEWFSGTVSDGDRGRTSSETGLSVVDEYRKKKKK